MKIAVEGCAHGDLENIYDTIHAVEQTKGITVDLLICCGDFQSSRNKDDLMCMAVPQKYQHICTFYKYYSGEKVAPILTIFIGGNHEASNYLQELPYGGWVAPNIYYVGYAGVINIAGLRIAGLSGIYKGADYTKGHYEKPPYTENSKRSVYHVRNLEIFRLKQISGKVDIMLTHDWPSDVIKFGNVKQLVKRKPHFKEEIEKGDLGSKPYNDILHKLKPHYWFAAHLHCKYSALVKHKEDELTKFLALDKCLPKRKFLQILDIPHNEDSKIEINYDLEWLTILYLTNHLLSTKSSTTYMPGPGGNERYNFTPTEEEKDHVRQRLTDGMVIPKVFSRTALAFSPNSPSTKSKQPEPILNPQTVNLCEMLVIDDPLAEVSKLDGTLEQLNLSVDLNSTISFIDDTKDDSLNLSQGTPIKKLLNLSLPDPILDENEDLENSETENDSREHNQVMVSSLTIEEQTQGDNDCNSPMPRKLRRRNVELYKNE